VEEYIEVIWDETESDINEWTVMKFAELIDKVDNGELHTLYAYGLEYFPLEEYDEKVLGALRKVEEGGVVVFRITNLGHVIKNVLRREFEPEKYNELLWNGKKSGITVDKFKDFVSKYGKINDIRMEGQYYYVTVQR
jgi:hypothetical protein